MHGSFVFQSRLLVAPRFTFSSLPLALYPRVAFAPLTYPGLLASPIFDLYSTLTGLWLPNEIGVLVILSIVFKTMKESYGYQFDYVSIYIQTLQVLNKNTNGNDPFELFPFRHFWIATAVASGYGYHGWLHFDLLRACAFCWFSFNPSLSDSAFYNFILRLSLRFSFR